MLRMSLDYFLFQMESILKENYFHIEQWNQKRNYTRLMSVNDHDDVFGSHSDAMMNEKCEWWAFG
jgi:hypothetical protein